MHENHSSANDTQKRSATFDYHPDPCIALRLALLGFSGGKGSPKVGLTRQSVECHMRCETQLDPVRKLLYMRIFEGPTTHKMSITFDYHPDPCIALRLALFGFSGGKGAPKVGLTRQSVECPQAKRNTAGSSAHPFVHENN